MPRRGENIKKIYIIGIALIVLCVSLTAVSADDGWSFNFQSSESSNSNGGSVSFENGALIQNP